MRLCHFLKLIGFMTVLSLAYIHMQMQIFDLAYQGNQKEQQIKKLIEENGNATYKILMLKSANNLGATMLDEHSDMQFADQSDIVQINTSEEFLEQKLFGGQPKIVKKTNPLINLLSFGVVAEAKTAE